MPQNIFDHLCSVLKDHPGVIFAYLFGSRARNEAFPQSDIDVAVYLEEDVDPLEEKLGLIGDFADRLQRDDIDVVVLNSAPLSLLGRVMAHHMVLLDRNPHLRHRFESLAIRKYLDFSVKEKSLLERRFGFGR